MATLRLRNGVWYLEYRYKGKRYQKSTKTSDRKLAEIRLHELEIKIFKEELDEKDVPLRDASLLNLFNRFRNHIADNYARSDMEIKRLLKWQEFFASKGVIGLSQIHAGHVQEFLATVLAKRSPKTKRNYLSLLKTGLNYAVEWQIIEANPILRVKPPKIVTKFHYFQQEEIATLVREANEPLRTVIILLVNTGLRRSELWNLRWRDVNLRKKLLTVMPYGEYKTKSRKPRGVPLNQAAMDALRQLKKDSKDEFVCRSRAKGTFTDRFRELVRRLGLKGRLHDLRHTFASHLTMAGTPIPVIKELLGHSDIQTTMIYAHLSPDIHQAEVEKLEF